MSTGKVVCKGCVGECGESSNCVYKVDSKIPILMIARTVETSLCPNTGAWAWLFRNGKLVANGSITRNGASIQAEASPGDEIVVHVQTHPLYNQIQCVRLGELNFVLIQQDFVK